MRNPPATSALLALLFFSGCATLDKEGEKTFVRKDSAHPAPALQVAALDVFGRAGYTTGSPYSNPVMYQRPVRGADALAYKDFFMETDTVDRVTIQFLPKPEGGTRMNLTFQILHRPGTMFESPKFPVVGSRARFSRMLDEVEEMAGTGMEAAVPANLPPPPLQIGPTWNPGGF